MRVPSGSPSSQVYAEWSDVESRWDMAVMPGVATGERPSQKLIIGPRQWRTTHVTQMGGDAAESPLG